MIMQTLLSLVAHMVVVMTTPYDNPGAATNDKDSSSWSLVYLFLDSKDPESILIDTFMSDQSLSDVNLRAALSYRNIDVWFKI